MGVVQWSVEEVEFLMGEKEDKFLFYKYFSNKFVLPLVGMGVWSGLVYTGNAETLEEKALTAVVLLCFAGILSIVDVIKYYDSRKVER